MNRTTRLLAALAGGYISFVLAIFALSQIAGTPESWRVDLAYSVAFVGGGVAITLGIVLVTVAVCEWVSRGDN